MKFKVFYTAKQEAGAFPHVHPGETAKRPSLPEEWNIISEGFPASGINILYGPSGSGKTRLMQAAARYLSSQKGFDILHCCTYDLIWEMANAIKKSTYDAFRESLMRRDALFIDNIWLLRNKRRTALAVFVLLELFAGKGGLVLIASDLPPSLLLEWFHDKR